MPTEDMAAYRSHLKSFTDEYNPKGATEAQLVQQLADTSWRLNRAASLEANLFTLAAARLPDPLTDAPDEVQATMAIAAALESQSKALMNLSLHTQRLSRQFERTAAQLRDIQETRLAAEKDQLNDLVNIIKMHESKGKTYNPSSDGFVFTEHEIARAIQSRTRRNLASQALRAAAA
jgi:ATP-dependent Clp protease ATP-binding subunit ClpA